MQSPFSVVTHAMFMQLLLPTFLIHLTRGLTVACLPMFILNGLELSKFHVGIAIGAIGLGKIAIDLPASVLLDRVGSRKLMVLSALVIGVSAIWNMFMVSLESFGGLVLGLFVYGAGQGTGVLSRLAMMSEQISTNERGRVSSMLGGSDRLAMAIGPLLGALGIAIFGGIVGVFILQSSCAFASAAVVSFSASSISELSTRTNVEFCSSGWQQRVNLAILLNVSVFVLALQLVREARKLAIPITGYEIGMSSDQVAWYSTISFGTDALLFLISGSLMDSHGRILTGTASISCLVLSMLVLVPGISGDIILLHALLAGIGNGLSAGIVPALGADLAPKTDKSEFLGYYRLFADLGEFVGPFIVGVASQFTSVPTMMNIVACIGTAGGFWLTIFVPEPVIVEK